MEQNPYQAPSAAPQAPVAQDYTVQQVELSPRLVDLFRRTKGWVIFVGVMAIILGLLAILGGVAMLILMSSSSPELQEIYGYGSIIGVIGVGYLVVGALSIFIGARLCGYAASINRLQTTSSMQNAETAVDRQRAVWKLIGVLAAVLILMMILVTLGSAAMSASAARSGY